MFRAPVVKTTICEDGNLPGRDYNVGASGQMSYIEQKFSFSRRYSHDLPQPHFRLCAGAADARHYITALLAAEYVGHVALLLQRVQP